MPKADRLQSAKTNAESSRSVALRSGAFALSVSNYLAKNISGDIGRVGRALERWWTKKEV